jgi:hypothetical protein
MKLVKRRNRLRSEAILEKNKQFMKAKRGQISSSKVRHNLNNDESTTFRINDVPHLLGK